MRRIRIRGVGCLSRRESDAEMSISCELMARLNCSWIKQPRQVEPSKDVRLWMRLLLQLAGLAMDSIQYTNSIWPELHYFDLLRICRTTSRTTSCTTSRHVGMLWICLRFDTDSGTRAVRTTWCGFADDFRLGADLSYSLLRNTSTTNHSKWSLGLW